MSVGRSFLPKGIGQGSIRAGLITAIRNPPTSVITLKAANGYQFKPGQRK
jgi:hypothetical protein